jgi:hypothetical protein
MGQIVNKKFGGDGGKKLWYVDPLLGNDREINSYTTDVAN